MAKTSRVIRKNLGVYLRRVAFFVPVPQLPLGLRPSCVVRVYAARDSPYPPVVGRLRRVKSRSE